jgi:hypothetical protein
MLVALSLVGMMLLALSPAPTMLVAPSRAPLSRPRTRLSPQRQHEVLGQAAEQAFLDRHLRRMAPYAL